MAWGRLALGARARRCSATSAMLGLGPIGTLKGIKPTGGDAKKPGLGKKPATSTLDFDFSDDDEPGALDFPQPTFTFTEGVDAEAVLEVLIWIGANSLIIVDTAQSLFLTRTRLKKMHTINTRVTQVDHFSGKIVGN